MLTYHINSRMVLKKASHTFKLIFVERREKSDAPESDINEIVFMSLLCICSFLWNINALSFKFIDPFLISIWNMNTCVCVKHLHNRTRVHTNTHTGKKVDCKTILIYVKLNEVTKCELLNGSFEKNGKWVNLHLLYIQMNSVIQPFWLYVFLMYKCHCAQNTQDSNFNSILHLFFEIDFSFLFHFVFTIPHDAHNIMCVQCAVNFTGTTQNIQNTIHLIWSTLSSHSLNHFIRIQTHCIVSSPFSR